MELLSTVYSMVVCKLGPLREPRRVEGAKSPPHAFSKVQRWKGGIKSVQTRESQQNMLLALVGYFSVRQTGLKKNRIRTGFVFSVLVETCQPRYIEAMLGLEYPC